MLTGRPSLRRDGAGISRRQEPRAVAQEQGSHVARHSSHSKSCGERRESVGPYLVGTVQENMLNSVHAGTVL